MREEMMKLAEAMTPVPAEEKQTLSLLCAAAEQEILRRLSCPPEDCREACVCAGAWLAVAGLVTGRAAGGEGRFTVGDVSIASGQGGKSAQNLRREAERLLAPYCRDGGFAFREVAG